MKNLHVLGIFATCLAMPVMAQTLSTDDMVACQASGEAECRFEIAELTIASDGFAETCRADLTALGCQTTTMELLFSGMTLTQNTSEPHEQLDVIERYYSSTEKILPSIRTGPTPFSLYQAEACIALGDAGCIEEVLPSVQWLASAESDSDFSKRVLRERHADLDDRLNETLEQARSVAQ